ncbi:MAG TPA: hypothetical protein VFQ39_16185 [Longimicrobium sp.]|nr:hypothetical protein [Longimicrobium sp.]
MSPRNDEIPVPAAAPVRIPGGTVAGSDLLRELPSPASLAAWQVLRTVLLWSGVEAHARMHVFDPEVMEEWEGKLLVDTFDAAVRNPLAVIIGAFARPGPDTGGQVSWACLCVAEWALGRAAVRTGLAFAEAAALASPGNPRFAWLTGRLLRAHGKLKDAATWLQVAVQLAGREGDWEAQTLGLNSLGNTASDRGNYRLAGDKLRLALRSARRHNLPDREGEILHDLFVVHYAQGDLAGAETHAIAAFEAYAPSHPRLPALAHDVAFLWLSRGHFARALPILSVLERHFARPEDRLRIAASAARAAGACGDEPRFDRFWTGALSLAEQATTRTGVASAFVELALGASNLEQWERALVALDRADDIAAQTGEADVQARAEIARVAVVSRRAADDACGYVLRSDAVVDRVAATLEAAATV